MKDLRTGRIGKHNYQLLESLIETGKTSAEIADIFGVNPETVRKYARNRGLKIRRVDMKMERHPCWNGGTTYDRSGYLLRRVLKDGPYGYLIRAIAQRGKPGTDYSGYAPEHRIVAHDMLGRKLLPGEVVDHIDGNKLNNAPSNLRIFPSNAEHLRVTLKGKVPNWTHEGFAAMKAPRPNHWKKALPQKPTRARSKTDGLASPQ